MTTQTDQPLPADDCPTCGARNPSGNRFCGSCGTRLGDAEPVTRGDERKVVTVLFCDLVGFTSSSEGADPEDVRSLLKPYHELAQLGPPRSPASRPGSRRALPDSAAP